MIEAVYLGLRQADGIIFEQFRRRFQLEFKECFKDVLDRLVADNLLVFNENGCRLTREGMLLSDRVVQALSDEIP